MLKIKTCSQVLQVKTIVMLKRSKLICKGVSPHLCGCNSLPPLKNKTTKSLEDNVITAIGVCYRLHNSFQMPVSPGILQNLVNCSRNHFSQPQWLKFPFQVRIYKGQGSGPEVCLYALIGKPREGNKVYPAQFTLTTCWNSTFRKDTHLEIEQRNVALISIKL